MRVPLRAESYAHVTVADTRDDVGLVTKATRWLYDPLTNDVKYLSFNAPVPAPLDAQCGRAVFSDVHLSGGVTSPVTFPAECRTTQADHVNNELTLEFLFFDLSSCVQDDAKPPPIPPPR